MENGLLVYLLWMFVKSAGMPIITTWYLMMGMPPTNGWDGMGGIVDMLRPTGSWLILPPIALLVLFAVMGLCTTLFMWAYVIFSIMTVIYQCGCSSANCAGGFLMFVLPGFLVGWKLRHKLLNPIDQWAGVYAFNMIIDIQNALAGIVTVASVVKPTIKGIRRI